MYYYYYYLGVLAAEEEKKYPVGAWVPNDVIVTLMRHRRWNESFGRYVAAGIMSQSLQLRRFP